MTSATSPPVNRRSGLPIWLQALLILGAAAIPAVLTGGHTHLSPAPPEFQENGTRTERVSIAQAMALDHVLWLDARPRKDFDSGHIPGAMPLSEDAWETDLVDVLMAWNPGDTIVIYCSTTACGTSTEVARRLVAETNLHPVLILHGGWQPPEAPTPGSHGS